MTREIQERISRLHPSIKIDVRPGENLEHFERIHANVLSRNHGKYRGILFFSRHGFNAGKGEGWSVDFQHNPSLGFPGTAVMKTRSVQPSLYVGTDVERFCAGWFRYIESYVRSCIDYESRFAGGRECDFSFLNRLPHPEDIYHIIMEGVAFDTIRQVNKM